MTVLRVSLAARSPGTLLGPGYGHADARLSIRPRLPYPPSLTLWLPYHSSLPLRNSCFADGHADPPGQGGEVGVVALGSLNTASSPV